MTKEQTEAATWARRLPRLRRNAEELREEGWEIREPPNVEVPPGRRGIPFPPRALEACPAREAFPGD